MIKVFSKKLYKLPQLYKFIEDYIRTIKFKNSKLVNKAFEKRIMLVVTEVNGCEICAYGHASEALKEGMSEQDIHSMLSGNMQDVPKDESVALFFAQHYADSSGIPTKDAWQRVLDTYGKDKSMAILANTRMIMMGNTIGIAAGAFRNRLKGNGAQKSSLAYELKIILCFIPFAISSFFSAKWKQITKQKLINFES